MHGLYGMIYGLVGVAESTNAAAVAEVLGEVRALGAGPRAPEFAALPMAELSTHGFEMLIRRALAHGFAQELIDAPAYAAHAAERQALGLE
jgi:hypothetical protein